MRSVCLLWCALSMGLMKGQSSLASDAYRRQELADARVEQELFIRSAHDHSALEAKQIAARQRAEDLQREFYSKANRFVDLWSHFSKELNEHQTINIKLAKKLSKAFHDLERSEGWPAVDGK